MKKHFSHPHALKLYIELDQKDEDDEVICSGCEQQLSVGDPAYTCSKKDCEYFLHKSCSELPRNMDHKSHPHHPLTLLSQPPEHSLYYNCNACGDLINGFSFYCEKCDGDFRLHVKCAFLPESVECKAHNKHAYLAIRYSTPDSTKDDAYCGVCDGGFTEGYWCYYCKECDFVTHFECAASADAKEEEEEDREDEEEEVDEDKDKDEEEEEEEDDDDDSEESDQMKLMRANIKAMDQMSKLQFQMQMAQINARAKSMFFRTYN